SIQLRRTGRPRQGQPRHHLAARPGRRGQRQPAAARGDRPGDRKEIVDDIQAALNEFAAVAEALEAAKSARQKETT
ncbi:MAG: hypothetical protein WBF76_10675, partial [Pseudonocardiaceae bacterium]